MSEPEYKHKLSVIETEYLQAKKQLYIDYATAHRKFKVGDIIKDNTGTIIEIQRFGTCVFTSLPKPTYIGLQLTKKLTPKKNGDFGTIYGNEGVELLSINKNSFLSYIENNFPNIKLD